MADVLKRGPVGDDDSIKRELAHLCDQILKRLPRLTYVDPIGSTQVATDLEDIANRLIDIAEAINERYLDQANSISPPSTGDLPDDRGFEII